MGTFEARGLIRLASFVALLMLTFSSFARAGDRPTVHIEVEPDHLVLGKDTRASLHARTDLDDARIRLRANVGSLAGLQSPATSRLDATYRTPDAFFPQLAVFAAVAESDTAIAHGWAVLPLWGTGRARVHSKPHARVLVSIGDTVYGPVRANRRGRATIEVVVPPGVTAARSGGKDIDLHVPAMNRIVAVADRVLLPCDGSRTTRVRAYVVTPSGKPDGQARPRMTPARGRMGPVTSPAPGVFESDYTPPKEPGTDQVTVQLDDEPASRSVVDLRLVPGNTARILLAATPQAITAGRKEPVTIEARTFDAAGNPVPADLRLKVDLGEASPPETIEPGRYRATWRLPAHFENRLSALLEAGLPDGPRAECRISLRPAEPVRIRFAPQARPVEADGRTPASIALEVLDAHNNPVPDADLTASATPGRITGIAKATETGYTVTYLPPRLRNPEYAMLQASTGRIRAQTQIELTGTLPLLTTTPRAGYLTNFGNLGAFYFDAEMGLHLFFLTRGLYLQASCGGYFSQEERADPDVSSSLWTVPLLVSVAYHLQVHDLLHLQFSAGGGLLFVGNDTRFGDQPEVERRAVTGGLQASAELGLALGPGLVVVRLAYLMAGDPGIEELSGDIGGLIMTGGYRFGFL